MATPSRILAGEILWTEEPGGPQSMRSEELDMTWRLNHHNHHVFWNWARAQVTQRVKNLWSVQEIRVQSLAWKEPLGRAWQSAPVSLPGRSHGQRSLAATVHRLAESDTAEPLGALAHAGFG